MSAIPPSPLSSPGFSPGLLLRPINSMLRTRSTDPRVQQQSMIKENNEEQSTLKSTEGKGHAAEDVKVEKPP